MVQGSQPADRARLPLRPALKVPKELPDRRYSIGASRASSSRALNKLRRGGRHQKPAGRLDAPADRFTRVKGQDSDEETLPRWRRSRRRPGGRPDGGRLRLRPSVWGGHHGHQFGGARIDPTRYPAEAAGGGLGAIAAATRAAAATSVTKVQAVNWAGYAASFGTTTFRFVSARFTVPTVDCSGVTAANGAWSSHWVGLDGFRSSSATVEQTGLLAGCNGTTPVYAPFWEMFPNAPRYPSITVKPGDKISVSVYYNRSTRKFTLTFSDTTRHRQFTRTRACPAGTTCRRNSAEAISEAPLDGSTGDILPLADFHTARFANVSITNTSGTHRGGLRSSFWNTLRITQIAGDGTNFTNYRQPDHRGNRPRQDDCPVPEAHLHRQVGVSQRLSGLPRGTDLCVSKRAALRSPRTSTGSHP
jgi:hypothetical protein